MWPSASYALARFHMLNKRKKKSPPEKPAGMNGDLSALWALVLHVNSRVDGLYALMAAVVLGVVAIFVTVLVK